MYMKLDNKIILKSFSFERNFFNHTNTLKNVLSAYLSDSVYKLLTARAFEYLIFFKIRPLCSLLLYYDYFCLNYTLNVNLIPHYFIFL